MYLPSKRPIIFTHPLFTGIMGLIWLSVATIPIPAFSSVPQWELENAAGMKAYQQKQFAPAKTHFLNALSSLGNMQTPSPEEATTLNNLGAVHEALGEYEEAELRIIDSYLPQMMRRQEIKEIAAKTIAELSADSPKDIGQVMGRLMPQIKGKTDGRLVNEVVRELLQN